MLKICIQYFRYIDNYIYCVIILCINVDMLLIFKCILYFPTESHPNSLQSMEKLPLIPRDFGRDLVKLLQNSVLIYLPCPASFFLFKLIIQLISFFIHEFDLINTFLSRHRDYVISLYQTEKKQNFSTLGHFFLLADMPVFLYLVLFCIHCKSKTLQRNFLDSHLLNKANQVPREQSCFLCLSTSAVSSSKQSYSKFLRALQQKYFRSSKQKFPGSPGSQLCFNSLLIRNYSNSTL